MNSTKDSEKRIEAFFKKYILPLHQEVKDGKRSHFQLVPDRTAAKDSYFEKPKAKELTYFTFYEMSSEEELKDNLIKLWEVLGDRQIDELAASLAALASHFKAKQIEQSDELNPYIYAMF